MVYGWGVSLSPDALLVLSSFSKAERKLKRLGVYGWGVSLSPDALLVLSSFSKAERKLKRLGLKSIEGIIFHQDKGTIYTSASCTTEVLNSGGYLSYSAKKNCLFR